MSVFGLLGGKLGHSYSPEIHASLGVEDYRLFERAEEDVGPFLASDEWTALNVTIPYKKTVIPYCAELSDEARRIGSVNTILRTTGGLRGENTDYAGFLYTLRSAGFVLRGTKCLILGSGGAAVTAQTVVRDEGGTAVVISRSGEDNYGNLDRHADAAFIVNATPVGMFPNNGAAPLSLVRFPHLRGVVDMIYNPRRTALMLEAERLGVPAVGGLDMLAAQGRRAAELFLGHPIGDDRLAQTIRAVRAAKENVILIGMPGAGKSTAGRALAAACGLRFTDTDEEIAASGRTPAEIIRTDGEAAFREIETEAARRLGMGSGTVIACGGGIVTRPENYDLLHQNGTIVWLRRPLEALALGDRPLSQRDGVRALYEARRDLYESWSDAAVDVADDPSETAARIRTAVEKLREQQ